MRTILKSSLTAFLLLLSCAVALAQTDRKEVRAGNRQFKKGNWQNAEIEYRKAQVKDSLSFAANYNLAGALYKENNFDEAGKSLEKLKDVAPASEHAADYFYNLGNIAVQKKDWKAAVDAYKRSLLQNPDDLDAKENYAYAKQMLKNEEQQGGGGAMTSRIIRISNRTRIITTRTRIKIRIRTRIRNRIMIKTRIRIKEISRSLSKVMARERRRSPRSRPSRC